MCKVKSKKYTAKDWESAYASAKTGSISGVEKLLCIADGHIQNAAGAYARNMHDKKDIEQSIREYIIKNTLNDEKRILNPEHYFNKAILYTAKHNKIMLDKYSNKNQFFNQVSEKDDKIKDAEYNFETKSIAMPYVTCYLREVLDEIAKLPKIEKRILLAPIIEKMRSKDLSKELNLTVANIDKIRERIRKELAKKCEYYV